MSTGRLIAFGIGWVLASLAIGIVTGVVVSEVLSFIGLVDPDSGSYAVSLNVVAFGVAAVLIVVPFVFRSRFSDSDDA